MVGFDDNRLEDEGARRRSVRPASVSDSRTVPFFVLAGQANGDVAAEAFGDDLVAEALERADRVELEDSDTHVEESNETM